MQAAFGDCVINIIEKSIVGNRSTLWILISTRGVHRADTVARMVASCMNHIHDSSGRRVFNALHFPMSLTRRQHTDAHITHQGMWDNAIRWATRPWLVCPPEGRLPRDRYGYAACMESEGSFRQFTKIWEYVASLKAVLTF